jgi:D-psicose/D-tagatose/L-ribulose 3-epimerase
MNLSVSNLAWENENLITVIEILKNNNIANIEAVFTKLCDWDNVDDKKLFDFKKILNNNSISISSIQSIFHGVRVESLDDDNKIINHFKKVIKYSKLLGIKTIVLGSPNLRKKETFKNLNSLFEKIDTLLQQNELFLCIEPNSRTYGGDYFFTVGEIVDYLKTTNFKNIKTMIDTHNLLLEGDSPIDILKTYFEYIYHIHISEPNLKPISDQVFHTEFSKSLEDIGYNKLITYELLQHPNFEKNVNTFSYIYTN